MATLSIIGGAQAQSSVTLFGVVDAAVGHYSVSGGQSVTALVSSGNSSSRLGFRGTEDLGGGLSAGFWLEAGINNDNGSFTGTNTDSLTSSTGGGGLTFNRRSTVSLAGGFGEIRLGRDYTPTFMNDTAFDPFGTNGVGTNMASAGNSLAHAQIGLTNYVRSSNSVGYFLPPNLGGVYGQLQYAFSEQLSGVGSVGRYIGGRLGWASGPIDVALAVGKTNGDKILLSSLKTISLGGSYNFGPAKLMGEYSVINYDNFSSRDSGKGWLIGVSVPVGAGEIKGSYSRIAQDVKNARDPSASKIAVGYVHTLSKRTALYGTYARVSNKEGANMVAGGSNGYNAPAGIADKSSTGYEFGMRHSF